MCSRAPHGRSAWHSNGTSPSCLSPDGRAAGSGRLSRLHTDSYPQEEGNDACLRSKFRQVGKYV